LGMNVFEKAGYADIPGALARSIAAGVYSQSLGILFDGVEVGCVASERSRDRESVLSAIHRSIALVQHRLRAN
jgi:hypothetical protein